MGTSDRAEHCQRIFKAIGPYGEGVFSFVERTESVFRKHRYEGDTDTSIVMDLAIYDANDILSIKKLTEQTIAKAVMLGTSQKEIMEWIDGALVDYVMDA